MIIKTDFTDCNTFFFTAELFEHGQITLLAAFCFMGMNTASSIDKIKFICKLKACKRRRHITAAINYAANALTLQGAKQLFAIIIKSFTVIVSVTVKDIIHNLSNLASCGNTVNKDNLNVIFCAVSCKNHSATFNAAENSRLEV